VSENGDLLVGQGSFDAVGVVAQPIILLFVVSLFICRIVGGVLCRRMVGSEEVGLEVICRELGEMSFVECIHFSLRKMASQRFAEQETSEVPTWLI